MVRLPDNKLICIATAEAWHLGVLSSSLHVQWSLEAGALLEDRPVYVKSLCFDPFPFPTVTSAQAAKIGHLAEALDSHRTARLAAHPFLTLTGLYNALGAVRAGRGLTKAERDTVDAGQVATLLHLHQQLDAAVAAAYGWPVNLSAADVVARVVALNKERYEAEAHGIVNWFRPAYQAPAEMQVRGAQTVMDMAQATAILPWPKQAPEQFIALRTALARGGPGGASDLAGRFEKPPASARVRTMQKTLVALGQARNAGGGRYAA